VEEGHTLPPYNGRISVAIAMHTSGQRVYVIGTPFRAAQVCLGPTIRAPLAAHGAAMRRALPTARANYSSGVWVDSQNPDILYTIATTVYRSTDGGKTFSAFKGAPGGEDPHVAWLTRRQPAYLLRLRSGPGITLDGGQTWSGYYQIPIAQIYTSPPITGTRIGSWGRSRTPARS
jgi:hypothetical protein